MYVDTFVLRTLEAKLGEKFKLPAGVVVLKSGFDSRTQTLTIWYGNPTEA